MTNEKIKITFYNIEKCGIYTKHNTEHAFGTVSEIFADFKKWVTQPNMTLEGTSTYEEDSKLGFLKCYCTDIYHNKDNDDYLITTWNEIASKKGNIHSINKNTKIGANKVNTTSLPKGAIPGYACIFWIIPEKKTYATIRFDNVLLGRKQFEKTVRSYIAKFSRYAKVVGKDDSEYEIVGYVKDQDSEVINKANAVFYGKLHRDITDTKQLYENFGEIYKIIKKNRLNYSVPQEKGLVQKVLENLNIIESSDFDDDECFKIKYEVDITPTKSELKTIIEDWENQEDKSFNDVGFKLRNKSIDTYWLSNTILKDEIELNIDRINSEFINISKLSESLKPYRSRLLSKII